MHRTEKLPQHIRPIINPLLGHSSHALANAASILQIYHRASTETSQRRKMPKVSAAASKNSADTVPKNHKARKMPKLSAAFSTFAKSQSKKNVESKFRILHLRSLAPIYLTRTIRTHLPHFTHPQHHIRTGQKYRHKVSDLYTTSLVAHPSPALARAAYIRQICKKTQQRAYIAQKNNERKYHILHLRSRSPVYLSRTLRFTYHTCNRRIATHAQSLKHTAK